MNTILKRAGQSLFLLALIWAIGACAPVGTIGVDQMAANLQYRGFSLPRPDDSRWQLDAAQQSPRSAQFFFAPLSATHTFSASVENREAPADISNAAEFRRYAEQSFTLDAARFEMISRTFDNTTVQSQPAIKYAIKALDNRPDAPEQPLVLTLAGYVVKHPSWPNTVIWVEYSERGTRSEVDGTLDRVGRAFVDSVVLESRPGQPL